VDDERVRQMRAELEFASTHVGFRGASLCAATPARRPPTAATPRPAR
jgi:hypothetical protein